MEFSQQSVISEAYNSTVEHLREFLSTANGSSFNICAYIFNVIKDTEAQLQPKLFKEAAILYEEVDTDESENAPISPYEVQKESLKENYGNIVNSIIEFHTRQQYSTELFYQNMWLTINNSVFFPTEAGRVFAFFYTLIDKRIPYYELQEGYQMSNDAFSALRKKHWEVLQKVRYILSISLSQKTERASLLLNELGIEIPRSDAPVESINAYEKQLIILVEAIQTLNTDNRFFDHLLAQIDDEKE